MRKDGPVVIPDRGGAVERGANGDEGGRKDAAAEGASRPLPERPAAARRGPAGLGQALARRAASGPYLVIAFFVLMGVAWTFGNPPGYAPDEEAHYIKAVGVGRGQLVGKPGAFPVGPGFGPRQLQWINKATRTVDVPPGLSSAGFACSVFNPTISASCLYDMERNEVTRPSLTYVGSYEPFLYLPAGLVVNQADHAVTALLLGRSVMAVISIGLLAAAATVLMIPGAGARSLIGLVAATTPMVIFLATELAPMGPEISAAICCTAVVLRLGRDQPVPPWVWLVAAVAGGVLATSRSLGPFFLAAVLAIFVVAAGPGRAVRILRRGGRWALGAGIVTFLGVAANVAWSIRVQPNPPTNLNSVLSWLWPSVKEVPEVLRQGIGVFGWQDVNMPRLAYLAWGAIVAILVILAFVAGERRQRLLLAVTIAGCFVGTVLVAAVVIHQTHFPMYGRYALPLWVMVPLVAGEVVIANRWRLPSPVMGSLIVSLPVVAAAVHATAWYVNGRRYAVSDYGPVFWPGHSQWAPGGGWGPWFAVTAVAVACLVAYAVLAAREDRTAAQVTSRDLADR